MVKAFSFCLILAMSAPASADSVHILSKKLKLDLGSKPLTLGVLNFTYDQGRMNTGSYLVSERLLTYLVQDGATVVERRLLDSLLSEQHFAHIGVTNVDSLKKVGKVLGVNAVVVGTLLDQPNGANTEILARVIDVESTKVLTAGTIITEHEWHDVACPPKRAQGRVLVPQAPVAPVEPPPQEEENAPIRHDPDEPKRTLGEYTYISAPVPMFIPTSHFFSAPGGNIK